MTQVPPPPSMPYSSQPQRTNGAAIASLICGIVGCIPLAALAAVILGIIGISVSRKPQTGGKGMSIAGLILGCLWLLIVGALFILLLSAPTWAPRMASRFFRAPAEAASSSFINTLANGDTQSAKAFTTSDLSTERLSSLGAELKSYGKFKSLSITNVDLDPKSPDGQFHLKITGSLVFDSTNKTFEASLGRDPSSPSKFKIEDFNIK